MLGGRLRDSLLLLALLRCRLCVGGLLGVLLGIDGLAVAFGRVADADELAGGVRTGAGLFVGIVLGLLRQLGHLLL